MADFPVWRDNSRPEAVCRRGAGLDYLPLSARWSSSGALPVDTEAILATCDDCIKILDFDGRILFINDAGLQMMEFADFRLIQDRCWHELMSGNGPLEAAEAMTRAAQGETTRFQCEVFTAKGNVRHWDVQVTPLRDRQGKPIQAFTIARNITEQRCVEQQQALLLADQRHANDTLERRVLERTAELAAANDKLMVEMAEHKRMGRRLQELQGELYHAARLSAAGEMASTLAHELNQPLTATISSIDAARRLFTGDEVDFPIVQEVMDEAAGQAKRAGQIVRRLRDFVARGQTEKRFESVATMVEEASALSLVGVEAFGLPTRFSFDPKVSMAFVDRIQVQQVLANLMRNAIEAMAGQPSRKLEVRTALVGDDQVEVAVADSGPGLPKHVADRLFQPFVSTKRNGMGLGLSICRSIVEAQGGTLCYEAIPAGGTVFRFTLPAAMTESEAGVQ